MISSRKRVILPHVAALVLTTLPIASDRLGPDAPPAAISPTAPTATTANHNVRFGMPAVAFTDPKHPENYLIDRPQYVLSYNNKTKTPNWVCWNLTKADIGKTERGAFEPDTSLPTGFDQVTPKVYSNSGFDRGHMCNSKDRSDTVENNNATFLMTNMIPQAPANNEHTWEALEEYCRSLATTGKDLYIVSGPHGEGGTGKNGYSTHVGSGPVAVAVPAKTWKVVMVLDSVGAQPNRQTRMFGVIMPNDQSIDPDWKKYLVSVQDVEKLTGYNFFPDVDQKLADVIKSDVDSNLATPVSKSRRTK
jgi:endonuclease G